MSCYPSQGVKLTFYHVPSVHQLKTANETRSLIDSSPLYFILFSQVLRHHGCNQSHNPYL